MLKYCYFFLLSCIAIIVHAQDRGIILKPYNNSLSTPLKGDSGKRKAALVVGISDYNSQKLTLKYANKDAGLFFNYLTNIRNFPKENIFLLPDSAATSGKIYNSILDLMKWLEAGDELVLYFAGHGDVQTVADFDEAFFLAWDASDSRNYFGAAGTLKLSDLELYTNRLAKNKKVKVSLIMDACHAGFSLHNDGILKAQDNISGGFTQVAKLLGCGVNEFSYEADSVGHGLFTWYLVQGMMGLADEPADNKLTLNELSSFVKNRVSAATKGKQNPVMSAPDEQEILADITADNKASALAFFRKKKYDGFLAGRGSGQTDTTDMAALEQYVDGYNNFLMKGKLYGTDSSSLGIIKKLASLGTVNAASLQLSLQNHLAEILETNSQLVLNEYLKGKSEQPTAAVYYTAGMDAAMADSLLPDLDPRKKNNQVMESFHKAYSYIRYENFEKYPEAENLLRKALALENRAAYLYIALSYLMEYQHKYDSAIYYAKIAETIIPTWTHPKNVLGNLYEGQYEYEKALTYHHSVLNLDSSYVWSFNNIGVSLLNMDRLKEAEYYFTQSLLLKQKSGRERLNRDWAISYSNLAAIFIERGNISKAQQYYAISDSIDPTYTFALRKMSELYEKTDGEKSEELLKRSIALMPFEAENYYTLAEFYRLNPANTKTIGFIDSLYQTAIRLNPFDESFYGGMGNLMMDEKQNEAALRWFTKGIEASGTTAASYNQLAYYHKNLLHFDSAIADYKKALAINRYDIYSADELANVFLLQADTLEAEKILLQAQTLHPCSPKMQNVLGNFYFRIGRLQLAIARFENCIQLDESYLKAINALAYLNLLEGNVKNSRYQIKQLHHQDPDHAHIIAYINAVAERSYKIPLSKRALWLNGFRDIEPNNELINELISETAYLTGFGFQKAFGQAKIAEEKSEFNNPVLVKWLFLLSIELNDIKQMKLFAGRYLDETLNIDPIIQSVAMKLTGNHIEAKKIKSGIRYGDIRSYQVNLKKIFSGI